MNRNPQEIFDRNELDASLQRLGVQELEERLEISPLLLASETTAADGTSVCCSCKLPPDILEDGSLPYPQVDPGPDTSGIVGGL